MMLFLSRVAALAALTLSLVGLAQSAPGIAAELDRTAIAAAVPVSTSVRVLPGADTAPTTAPTTVAATPSSPSPSSPSTPTLTPAIATDTDVVATPTGRFESLADAVAAQDVIAETAADDLRCLASAIYYESKGEPMAGQLAVAQVIMNRARSGRFASDLCGVVTQRGQFSFVHGGVIPTIDAARPGYRTALAVAKVALTAAWNSGAEGALFFHARRVAPAGRFVRVAAIGNHIFYR